MNARNFKTITGILVLMLLFSACSNENPFEPGTGKQGQDIMAVTAHPTVPFHDDFLTTFTFVPPFPDPPTQIFSHLAIRGTGISTHMGRSQMFEESQLNVLTGTQTGSGVTTGGIRNRSRCQRGLVFLRCHHIHRRYRDIRRCQWGGNLRRNGESRVQHRSPHRGCGSHAFVARWVTDE